MRKLIDIVQQTDLIYAQMMNKVGEETAAFSAKMRELYNSFNDNFPLTSNDLIGVTNTKTRTAIMPAEGKWDKTKVLMGSFWNGISDHFIELYDNNIANFINYFPDYFFSMDTSLKDL